MPQSVCDRLRGADDDERGFTLIELLVVILIIGILAAIALPMFLGQQRKAQDASAKNDVRNAVTQIESCLTDRTFDSAPACGDKATNDGLNALKLITTSSSELSTDGAMVFSTTARSKSGKTYSIAKDAIGKSTYTTTADDPKWVDNTTP